MLSIVPYEPTATDWSRPRRQVNCYQTDRLNPARHSTPHRLRATQAYITPNSSAYPTFLFFSALAKKCFAGMLVCIQNHYFVRYLST